MSNLAVDLCRPMLRPTISILFRRYHSRSVFAPSAPVSLWVQWTLWRIAQTILVCHGLLMTIWYHRKSQRYGLLISRWELRSRKCGVLEKSEMKVYMRYADVCFVFRYRSLQR